MKKTQFRNSAPRVAKVTVDVEKKRSKKKGGTPAETSAVVVETLNP